MPHTYEPEFKKKIVRLHLEEGRTHKSISVEYGVSKSCITRWWTRQCDESSKECQTSLGRLWLYEGEPPPEKGARRTKKGSGIPKKATAFFAKETG